MGQANVHPWTIIIRLGRRKMDPTVRVNFKRERVLVVYDTALIRGIYLENIDPEISKNSRGLPLKRGVAIMKRTWNNIYFLRERPADSQWNEDRYFFLADKIMSQKGIENP